MAALHRRQDLVPIPNAVVQGLHLARRQLCRGMRGTVKVIGDRAKEGDKEQAKLRAHRRVKALPLRGTRYCATCMQQCRHHRCIRHPHPNVAQDSMGHAGRPLALMACRTSVGTTYTRLVSWKGWRHSTRLPT